MQTILKTFRLPSDIVQMLEDSAEQKQMSQKDVLVDWITKSVKRERQWKEDLELMATDEQYKSEQIELAEEFYE